MAIALVSGSSVNFPLPFHSVRFLTTAIVSEMGYASGLHREVLFTIGLVLFAFIMLINTCLTKLLKSKDTQEKVKEARSRSEGKSCGTAGEKKNRAGAAVQGEA